MYIIIQCNIILICWWTKSNVINCSTQSIGRPSKFSLCFPETKKRAIVNGPAGARLVYIRTCQMMDIPISQSIYKCLQLTTISLKYHILSELQFRALATALAVSHLPVQPYTKQWVSSGIVFQMVRYATCYAEKCVHKEIYSFASPHLKILPSLLMCVKLDRVLNFTSALGVYIKANQSSVLKNIRLT